jgi:putative oxidoreductase
MSSGNLQSYGLAVLRIAVGGVILIHGYQKLFHMHLSGVAGFFGHIGIPLPMFFAAVVILVEFVGGILLITGLATRIPAMLLAIDMAVALLVVHLRNGFLKSGGELPLLLFAGAICLVLAGGGAGSIKRA